MLTASISFANIWAYVSQFFSEVELVYLVRVVIGGILGCCIGIERSRRQKEAGDASHAASPRTDFSRVVETECACCCVPCFAHVPRSQV